MPEKPEQTPYEQCLLAVEKLLAPLVKLMAPGAVALLHGGRAKMQGEGNYRVWNNENDTYGKTAHLHTWTFGSADDFQIENTMPDASANGSQAAAVSPVLRRRKTGATSCRHCRSLKN